MNKNRFEFYSDENLIGVLDTVTGRTFNSFEIVDVLNEQQATIKDLERKLQICSAHLLSDECCLTDGQIRKIIKEMTNE